SYWARFNSSVPPGFRVRLSSAYGLACLWMASFPGELPRPPAPESYKLARGGCSTPTPFTLTSNPSPAQTGRRTASVNAFGDGSVTLIVALSPSGKSVSILSCTPAVVNCAEDGTNRLTHNLSGDS